ncbi:MAG: NUDIX hydrolase [Rhodospirillales bacterium]
MTVNISREYPARPLVGVGAVIMGPKGVILIKRGKPPRAGSWSLPGGAQKTGETVYAAAMREIHEETGLSAQIHGLIDVVDSITRDDDGRVRFHYTLVDVWATPLNEDTPHAGGDAADVRWVSLEEARTLGLWSETLRIIEKADLMWRETLG